MTMYRRMALAIVMLVALASSIAAQTETQTQSDPQKARPRTTRAARKRTPDVTASETILRAHLPMFRLTLRLKGRNRRLKKLQFKPYYNNFFNTYRLGPEDVISVEVFNQDRYSRRGIIIPPMAAFHFR